MSALRRLVTLPADRKGRWVLLVIWIAVVAVTFPLSSKLSGAESNDASSYLPGSAEATKALHLQDTFTPPDVATAIVVYQRSSGITSADMTRARSDLTRILADGAVKRPPAGKTRPASVGPVTSTDHKAIQFAVALTAPQKSGDLLTGSVKEMRKVATSSDGLTVYVAGQAAFASDNNDAFSGIDGRLLLIAGAVVILILLVVYRSPVLWFVPVFSAGVSVIFAQAMNYLLAAHAGLTVNGLSAGVLNVLVFGAGTDYALLLVSRFREELRRHEDKHEAMRLALRRTSPAIVASAGTVIIALLCLLLSRLNSNAGLGAVAAVGIACTLITMSTLLPVLLVFLGRRIFWPFVPHFGTAGEEASGFWSRIGRACARNPRRIWVGTAVGFCVLCLGLVSINASGLSNAEQFTSKPDSVKGGQVLDDHFPNAGGGAPVYVIGKADAATALRATVQSTKGIVGKQTTVVGTKDGLVSLQASLADPVDSNAAYATIDRLRDRVHAISGADAVVGGVTAQNGDVNAAASHDTRLVIPLVLVVVFVVLALLLRALLAPLILMATVVLSFAGSLGVASFFFAHVFHYGAEDPSFPLFAFIFLVALGIDYNIFLVTRIREEVPRFGHREATVRAVTVTGGVITSAGVVLAATFGALATLPLVQLVEVGFAVAVGVLLDTFIVRSILVPALTIDIGNRFWWPSRLAHRMPQSSTEPPRQLDPQPS